MGPYRNIRVEAITLTDEFGDSWCAYGVFEAGNRKPAHLSRPRRLIPGVVMDPDLAVDGFSFPIPV